MINEGVTSPWARDLIVIGYFGYRHRCVINDFLLIIK